MAELILIGGGSCSGKTTAAKALKDYLGAAAVMLPMDNYYKGLSDEDKANSICYNFDHPDAVDFELIGDAIGCLCGGRAIKMPVYDFASHSRLDSYISVEPADYVICEGLFALYSRDIAAMSKLRFFVDCGVDIMIRRRIERDVQSRGRTVKSVVGQFLDTVLPMYYEYVEPTKRCADFVIDGRDAAVGILKVIKEQKI